MMAKSSLKKGDSRTPAILSCGVFFMSREKEPSALGSLRFLTGPLAGNTYPITKAITSLGRDPSNDIVISDPSVSRHHAQITRESASWSIKKLVAQNTLTVNQHNLPQSPLQDRDTIGLGPGTTFLFLIDTNASSQPNIAQTNLPSSSERNAPNTQAANATQNPYGIQQSPYPVGDIQVSNAINKSYGSQNSPYSVPNSQAANSPQARHTEPARSGSATRSAIHRLAQSV